LSDSNQSELDAIIKEVKEEIKTTFYKRKDKIIKLGEAYKHRGWRLESICEEIKNELHEEIGQRLISRRDIERYCPDEWKHKTKPKKEENDNSSFSQQEQEAIPQLLVDADGNSVVEPAAKPGSDSNNNDAIDSEESAKEGVNYAGEFRTDNRLEDVDLQQSLSAEDKIEKVEIEPETKSDQIIHVQSQVEELKSKIKMPPTINQEDKSFEAEFQLPVDPLCDHLRAYYNKHAKSIYFIAKADFITKSITNIQIKRIDGEFEPIN